MDKSYITIKFCPQCNQEFLTDSALCLHYVTLHEYKEYSLKCDKLNDTFVITLANGQVVTNETVPSKTFCNLESASRQGTPIVRPSAFVPTCNGVQNFLRNNIRQQLDQDGCGNVATATAISTPLQRPPCFSSSPSLPGFQMFFENESPSAYLDAKPVSAFSHLPAIVGYSSSPTMQTSSASPMNILFNGFNNGNDIKPPLFSIFPNTNLPTEPESSDRFSTASVKPTSPCADETLKTSGKISGNSKHRKKRDLRITCFYCSTIFRSYCRVVEHEMKHNEVKRYYCPKLALSQCHATDTFCAMNDLTNHVRECHRNDDGENDKFEWKCKKCGQAGYDFEKYSKHVEEEYSKERFEYYKTKWPSHLRYSECN